MTAQRLRIQEVGPREGMQFEGMGDPHRIRTADKAALVDSLSATGLGRIQVTSFVSPKAVPQMADAAAVSSLITVNPKVTYTALFFNQRGLQQAIDAGIYEIVGQLVLTASETFAMRNLRSTRAQEIDTQRSLVAAYQTAGIPVSRAAVMAAFGCNYEGKVPFDTVLSLVETLAAIVGEAGESLAEISLADSMGWADPAQVRSYVAAIRSRWPGVAVSLHLHDTRGLGMANALAALDVGVEALDSSVGGLGGCPFAGVAAGNVPTEDLVYLCERLGIETGVDLDELLRSVEVAEHVVGHPLPGRTGRLSPALLHL